MFEDSMDVFGDFLYTNQQELVERIYYVVDETFAIVIPYLERLRERFVGPGTPNILSELLSKNPSNLAQNAVQKFKLPVNRHIGYKSIEPALFALRGPDESRWRNIFFENLELIAGLAAYFSECIAERSISTSWYTETVPEIQTSDGPFPSQRILHFSTQYANNREGDFNLLQIIILFCKHMSKVCDQNCSTKVLKFQ